MSNSFGKKLISWYEKNKRDLPWRKTHDPYKIWLSEVILQQTRVEQGLSYYLAFIQRFPDVFALSKASPEEVYKMWQGLGYYNRADNLMIAARTIVENFGGVFPNEIKKLIKIRGIGSYTAAAIASFAFNLPTAVVDGNVFRVLSRMYGIDTLINTANGKREFELLANELIADHPPAVFNQAIMEFGALYCKPGVPQCSTCIFFEDCIAGKSKSAADYPIKKPKPKVTNRYFYYYLIESTINGDTAFLLKMRKDKDIWRNLYDMPLNEYKKPTDPLETFSNGQFQSLIGKTPYRIKNISETHIHQLTHQRIHARFVWLVVDNLPFDPIEKSLLLVNQSELKKHPVPRLIERYLQEKKLI